MPLLGTHLAAAQAMDDAEAAVKATWLAKNSVLSQAEIAQMKLEIRAAGIEALFTHMGATALIAVPALGLVSAAPSSPVTGAAVGTIT